MPGPHLHLHLMQCYQDVGGVDAWLAGHWNENSQWYTGWHLPGPAYATGGMAWSWPNANWILIGFERWDYFRKYPHTRLMEAMYQHPNPSTAREYELAEDPNFLIPVGHWHVTYRRSGQQQSCTWLPNALEEPQHLYLKGQVQDKGTGKGQEGKGKGKGKGKVQDKGKGKGQVLGKGKGKNGKGKGGKGKA